MTLTCQECKREFKTYPSRVKVGKKFCSQMCRRRFWSATESRFWFYVDKTATCWLWTGSHTPDGYGQYTFSGTNKSVLASKFSYERVNGPVPNGMFILHKCDNPPCINPDHLFLGTKKDNTMDAISKGRVARGEKVGCSKLTEQDIIRIRWLHKEGWDNTEIAPVFRVSAHQIGQVVRGKNWAHVEGVS